MQYPRAAMKAFHSVLSRARNRHRKYFSELTALVFLLTGFISVCEANHFVGFSQEKVSSTEGLVGMNKACRSTFHPEARVCNSREITDTAWPYTLGAKLAWVHPNIVASYYNNTNYTYRQVDYSGLMSETLSCGGWKSKSKLEHGLVVDGYLRFHTVQCGNTLYVACCEEPEKQ